MGDIFSRLADRIMREPSGVPVHGPLVEVALSPETPRPETADVTPEDKRRVAPEPPRTVSERRGDGIPRAASQARLDDDQDTLSEIDQPAFGTEAHMVTTGDEERSPVASPAVSETPVRPQVEEPTSATPRIVNARPSLPDPTFVLGGFAPIPEPLPDPGPNVEIHIGRLEVRANLEPEKPTLSRSRADAGPEPLALEDYLSGRKASR